MLNSRLAELSCMHKEEALARIAAHQVYMYVCVCVRARVCVCVCVRACVACL